MGNAKLLGMIMVMVLGSTVFAQEAAWEKVKDSDGISVYIRKSATSSAYECKTRGIVNANVASIEAMLRDPNSMQEYVINTRDVSIVEVPGYEKPTKDMNYVYARVDMPWPVSDRDNVGVVRFTVDPKTGTLYCRGHAIKTDVNKRPDVIRCPVNTLNYTVIPKDDRHSELTIHSMIDPGGSVPVSVVNFFAKHGSVWGFKKLCSIATKEKYRREGPLVTTTPETTETMSSLP